MHGRKAIRDRQRKAEAAAAAAAVAPAAPGDIPTIAGPTVPLTAKAPPVVDTSIAATRAKRVRALLLDVMKESWLPVVPLIELVHAYTMSGRGLTLHSVECIKDGESVNQGFGMGLIDADARHCVMWRRPPLATVFRKPWTEPTGGQGADRRRRRAEAAEQRKTEAEAKAAADGKAAPAATAEAPAVGTAASSTNPNANTPAFPPDFKPFKIRCSSSGLDRDPDESRHNHMLYFCGDDDDHKIRDVEPCDLVHEWVLVYTESGRGTNRVRSANLSRSERIDTLVGVPDLYEDGSALTAGFGYPYGIAVHPVDNSLYVAEYMHRVKRIDPVTGAVKTVAGVGGAGGGHVDGKGQSVRFGELRGITITGSGSHALVADYGNSTLRRIHLVDGVQQYTVDTFRMTGCSAIGADAAHSFKEFNAVVMEMEEDGKNSDRFALVLSKHEVIRADLKTGTITTLRPVLRVGKPPNDHLVPMAFEYSYVWYAAAFLTPNHLVLSNQRAVYAATVDVTTFPKEPMLRMSVLHEMRACGLCYDPAEDKLYATGGNDSVIHVLTGDVMGTIVDQ